MTSKKDYAKIQEKKVFNVGDVLKAKEEFRKFYNLPFHLYKVTKIREYSNGTEFDYVIRSINNQKIKTVIDHHCVNDYEKVGKFEYWCKTVIKKMKKR